jgi:hypothetical protein
MSAYKEHILEARDICANCHRLIRVEWVDAVRGGVTRQLDTHYERHRQTTTIEYGPSDAPPRSKGVFCECGNEDHRVQHRRWDDGDDRCLRMDCVKRLIKHTTEALQEKDVDFNTQRFIQLAIQFYRDDNDLDTALDQALETAIQIEVAKGEQRSAAD